MSSRTRKGPAPASDDEFDVSEAMANGQRRIMQLRREREERLAAVVAECQAELKTLAESRKDDYEQRRQDMAKEQMRHVKALMDSVERRMKIEEEMKSIVDGMCSVMHEVEGMMWAGYKGRWEETERCTGVRQ